MKPYDENDPSTYPIMKTSFGSHSILPTTFDVIEDDDFTDTRGKVTPLTSDDSKVIPMYANNSTKFNK